MPFIAIALKWLKPNDVPASPRTLGEHIKRRRLELGIVQKEACKALCICVETLINWENDRTAPSIRCIPVILQFLDYDPFPEPQTLGERMLAKRRVMGWTIREAARRLGVDQSTWRTWESTGHIRWERYRMLLEAFLQKRG